MPFAFSQVSPKNTGRVSRVEIPFTNYLGVAFEQGMHDSMFASISQIREMDLEREGPRITADEANERYGLPGLKFDTSVYESEAKLINERKQAEMRRNFYLEQGAPGGTWSKRGLAGLGTSMIASMLNPLDFSMNFMPVVGSEKMALQAQRLGRGAFRQALARGLLTTEEAIARRIPIAPRLTSSLIQGFVGNVAAEVPHFISSVQSKENYTVSDAAVNILGGTAIGGALHLVMSSAARILEKTTMPTRDAMMRKAVDDFVKGDSPSVAEYVNLDENIIREKVQFDEAAARAEAATQVKGADVKITELAPDELTGLRNDLPTDLISLEALRDEMIAKGNELAASGIEVSSQFKKQFDAVSDQIAEVRKRIDQKVEAVRASKIQELVDKKRKDWDENARFQKEKLAELQTQVAEGKILTEKQQQEFQFTADKVKAETTIKEQSSEIKKQIEELDEEVKADELTKDEIEEVKSVQNGIEQAIDCVIKNIP